MEDNQSRQEKRIAARRQQIIEGAVKVFIEKGFHRTTTKEIAEAAEVSEGTIYNYFQSKDDLLMGIVNQLAEIDPREALMDQALEIDLRTFLREHFVARMLELGDQYNLFLAVLPEILNTPALRERYYHELLERANHMFEGHLEKRVARGEIAVEDIPMVTRMFVAILYGLQVQMILGDPLVQAAWQDPAQLVTQIEALFFTGVVKEQKP